MRVTLLLMMLALFLSGCKEYLFVTLPEGAEVYKIEENGRSRWIWFEYERGCYMLVDQGGYQGVSLTSIHCG